MIATVVIKNQDDLAEIKYAPMIALSVLFHLIVFLIILYIPESQTTWQQIEDIVYEVNLVELPLTSPGSQGPTKVIQETGSNATGKETQAKRINVEKEEKPLVVAKKTVTKKETKTEKPEATSSQLIDNAIAKIEKKVKADDQNNIDKTISQLKKKVESGGNAQGGARAGQGIVGVPIQIYQMEVTNRIYSNWSYPVAAQNLKTLQAIVIIRVKEDGTILDTIFRDRSGNAIFDQSVLKAIEKSNPLPPLPEGYLKSYEEIEINFNLKDLEKK